ncbi:MAG TPA: hypothetical protein VMT89_04150, partial [Candidatus Acidoferrales bacterium]|nr:hypothetical protein [Candidatus Acidoferrales bacterium]
IVENRSDSLTTTYLAASLKYARLNQYAGRSAQPLVSGSRIYPIKIITPPIGDQWLFTERVAEIGRIQSSYHAHLAQLDALFASLQHRAFNGELTAKAAERELAEAV